jgi:type II secretory pathway pseudopilin PulG
VSGLGPQKKGFSLVEAMVALAIMIFMLAALSQLMHSTIQTNRQARRLTAAVHLAQDRMERLKGGGYAALANGSDGPLTEGNETTGTGLIFARSWTVTDNAGPPPPGTPPNGTRDVEVQVQWTDRDGTSHQVRLRTILSQS